jgi:hypothetical protein
MPRISRDKYLLSESFWSKKEKNKKKKRKEKRASSQIEPPPALLVSFPYIPACMAYADTEGGLLPLAAGQIHWKE